MRTRHTLCGSRSLRGFSLLEMILYLALSSIMGIVLVNVVLSTFEMREQAAGSEHLQRHLGFALSRMTTVMKEAKGVDFTASRFATDSGVLVLAMSGAGIDPTVFALQNGALSIAQGTSVPIPLTGSGVVVRQLHFTNYTPPFGRPTVGVTLGARTAPAGMNEQSLSLSTSVTLRQ